MVRKNDCVPSKCIIIKLFCDTYNCQTLSLSLSIFAYLLSNSMKVQLPYAIGSKLAKYSSVINDSSVSCSNPAPTPLTSHSKNNVLARS